ncbi:OmpA family protein [Thalassobaculum sp. OXR-137]|uniref:OmpA family protein n=1 Tax=Thalassobaculum sp. OXR-137 TaxID=3100173 RepID=UPI002AC9AC39|nr:OmpA family protein [Thalassobaculum sp. OXR-137]WPZ36904.1 OmpA family protein [Thalassobaculum sp. OXR-137]
MRGHRAHVALTLIAAAIAAAGGTAPLRAQTVTSPYIETNPNVTVDLSVLNGLGGSAGTMPGYAPPMPSPGAYPTPDVTPGAPTDIPAFLVRPDAPRYAAPPPAVQALIQGRSGGAPSTSGAAVPRATSPTPAPTLRAPAPQRATPQRAAPPPASTGSTASAPKPMTPKPQPEQTASAAPTPPPPPPAPSANTAARAAPAAPPPPAPPQPTRTASVAPPPPPPPAPTQEAAKPVSAPAAPAAAPAPKPSAQSAGGDTTRIAFPDGQSQLPGDAAAKLDPVIAKLKQDSGLRLQLMAYANGDQDGANKARRLSLSRALAVRAYLIDNEIASTRMDVRALGNRPDDGPADRVDLVVINR